MRIFFFVLADASTRAAIYNRARVASPPHQLNQSTEQEKPKGFFTRKKRQFEAYRRRKAAEAAAQAQEANAQPGTIMVDYLSPSFDTAIAVRGKIV